jgi:protein SSD1
LARVTDEVKPQFAGHVVAVVERMPGQLFSGTLGLLRPSSAATKEKQEAERREREGDKAEEPKKGPIERPKIVWFKPTDKRVPLIAIPTEQAPPDFVQNSEAYVDKLFVACIKRHVRHFVEVYTIMILMQHLAYQLFASIRHFGGGTRTYWQH